MRALKEPENCKYVYNGMKKVMLKAWFCNTNTVSIASYSRNKDIKK